MRRGDRTCRTPISRFHERLPTATYVHTYVRTYIRTYVRTYAAATATATLPVPGVAAAGAASGTAVADVTTAAAGAAATAAATAAAPPCFKKGAGRVRTALRAHNFCETFFTVLQCPLQPPVLPRR